MIELTQDEILAYMIQLGELEQDPATPKITFTAGPLTTFTLIGMLQLATRHPGLGATSREVVRDVVGQMRQAFAGDRVGEELIRRGDIPELDVLDVSEDDFAVVFGGAIGAHLMDQQGRCFTLDGQPL